MDIYRMIIERIVEKLETGVVPWHKIMAQHLSATQLFDYVDRYCA